MEPVQDDALRNLEVVHYELLEDSPVHLLSRSAFLFNIKTILIMSSTKLSVLEILSSVNYFQGVLIDKDHSRRIRREKFHHLPSAEAGSPET